MSMLYDIRLNIEYDYARPAGAGRHVVRLMPATIEREQRLIVGDLDIQPRPQERMARTDFFGNAVTEVAYRAAYDSISFTLSARVERIPLVPRLDISPGIEGLKLELHSMRSLDRNAPHHFVGASPRVSQDPRFAAYAQKHIQPGMTTLEAVEAVGLALYNDMEFDSDATTVDTSAIEAFEDGKGVCQDFSHILIACLRGVGIPAGYVSGFLRTKPPPGKPRLEGADAMHAWVRAWCGQETGWVEYDPTNAMWVGTDHIVVAHGRDYSDVSPVKGIMRISGKQTSQQAVDVIPVALAG